MEFDELSVEGSESKYTVSITSNQFGRKINYSKTPNNLCSVKQLY